ncbi:hypothetical protein [Acinetobacter terrae]|nr:hypothetical protein [Acinetobacter terrae]
MPNTNRFPLDNRGNPIIPASSIRGWLRFASYRSLLEVYKRRGELFSIHEHYLLAKGIDTGNLVESDRATIVGKNINIRKLNPIMDLYGRWGLASSLGVGSAIAPISGLRREASGSRGHIIDQFDDFEYYIVEEDQQLLSNIMNDDAEAAPQIQELKSQIKQLQADRRSAPVYEEKASLADQILVLQTEMDTIKKAKSGSSETMRHVRYGLEALDANVEASNTLKLTSDNDSSLQFLIWTISKLPLFRLGGGRAYNYGVVEPLWDITEHSFDNPTGEAIGQVGWKDGQFICDLRRGSFDLKEFQDQICDSDKFNFKVFG